MPKYFHLIAAIFHFWLVRTLEFRIQLIAWSINSLIWALLGLYSVHLIFGQVDSIAGWTRTEVLLLMTCQALFNTLLWVFVIPSLLDVSKAIRDGKFDFLLTKPANSRFLATFRVFEFAGTARMLVLIFLIIYLVSSLGLSFNLFSLFGFLVLFFSGLVIFYCLFFSLTILNFWFTKMNNLIDIFDALVVMGRAPTYVFQSGLRILFFYVLPVAFVATFPIQVLIQKGNLNLVILGVTMAGLFYFLSNRFWHFALRRYSSASS